MNTFKSIKEELNRNTAEPCVSGHLRPSTWRPIRGSAPIRGILGKL